MEKTECQRKAEEFLQRWHDSQAMQDRIDETKRAAEKLFE